VTAADLEDLGMTDGDLVREYAGATGLLVDLRGDGQAVEDRRARLFRDVTLQWTAVALPLGTMPIGPFAVDAPEIHAELATPR